MWTNVHSGLRWLGVALVWAGTGHYLQTRIYLERRIVLVRRAAKGMGGGMPSRPDRGKPDPGRPDPGAPRR